MVGECAGVWRVLLPGYYPSVGTADNGGGAWVAVWGPREVSHLPVDYVVGVVAAVGQEDVLVGVDALIDDTGEDGG